MIDALPKMRYCSWVASTQKTVPTVGRDSIWVTFGVRMSVEVRRSGSEGVACAARNARWMCDLTCGTLVTLSMDASWKAWGHQLHRRMDRIESGSY